MTDTRTQVTTVRIDEGAGGTQEERMMLVAIVGVPAVPHPVIRKTEHYQPFMPVEAMELTKARWKQMNRMRTGSVMSDV